MTKGREYNTQGNDEHRHVYYPKEFLLKAKGHLEKIVEAPEYWQNELLCTTNKATWDPKAAKYWMQHMPIDGKKC